MREQILPLLWLVSAICFSHLLTAQCSPPIIENFIVDDQSGVPSDDAACHNGLINFGVQVEWNSGTPPYQYLWTSTIKTGVTINNPNDPYSAIFFQNNTTSVQTTTITLVVTDNASCTATQTIDIDMSPHLVADVSVYENSGTPNDGGICYGDQITFDIDMNVAGTYTYLWDAGWTDEIVTFSPPYTNSPSFYYATVTNSFGCTAGAFEVAKGYTEIISTVEYVPGCDLGDPDQILFELSGGNPTVNGYFFQLNIAPNQWQHSPWLVEVPYGTAPGTLIDSLIKDEKGCREPVAFILPSHPGYLDVTEQVINSGCDPTGAVDQNITGGSTPFTFIWSNSSTNEDLNNVLAGTYYCTVTDANGCTFVNEAVVGYDPNGPGCAASLPVELTFFEAEVKNGSVMLHWQTASEVGNEGFEVLASANGQPFRTVGFLEGKGNTTATAYTFEHANPKQGANYYQLKQIDWDETATYSAVISVEIQREMSFSLFPNPAQQGHTVYLKVQLPQAQELGCQLLDVRGELVFRQNLFLEKGLHEVPLELGGLPNGIYFLKTFGGNAGYEFLKLVVE